MTQDEVVNRCPIALHKDTELEGALNLQSLQNISQQFQLTITPIFSNTISIVHPKESIFIFTFWENDPGQFHCVRFAGQNSSNIYVMNPQNNLNIEEHNLITFSKWVQLGIKINR